MRNNRIKKITILLEEDIDNKKDIDYITTQFNLQGKFNIIEKAQDSRRIIAGYANVAIVDNEDQFIPIDTLKKGINTLLNDPHYANLMLVHKNIQIGKIIEEFGEYKTHVNDKGLFIVAEIRNDIKTATEIWDNIINGDLNGFSIGCEVLSHHEECDDEKCIIVLDEINIFEVSVCSKPVNEPSGFIVISKSQLNEDVCEECDEIKDKMAKKTKKSEDSKEEIKSEEPKEEKPIEEPKEEKSDEPEEEEPTEIKSEEKTLEDRISDIERAVESMTELIQSLSKEEEEKSEEIEEKTEEEPIEEKQEELESESESEPKEEKSEESSIHEQLLTKMSELIDKLSEKSKEEELDLAIKSRDDRIAALEEKVKILNKSEDDKPEDIKENPKEEEEEEEPKPKAIQEKAEDELEPDIEYIIRKGEIYRA